MRFFPTHRQVRQARTRTVLSFFSIITWVALLFGAIIAGRYLLGWW